MKYGYLLILLCLTLISCEDENLVQGFAFESNWAERPNLERHFAGGGYWLNPLQAWQQKDGNLQVVSSGGDRNCVLLSNYLSDEPDDFWMSVDVRSLSEAKPSSTEEGQNTAKEQTPTDGNPSGDIAEFGWVGFQLGLQGAFGDYRDDAVHGRGFCAGITTRGQLFIGSPSANADFQTKEIKEGTLTIEAVFNLDENYDLKLSFETPDGKKESLEQTVDASWLKGLVALSCSQIQAKPVELKTPRPNFTEVPELGKKGGGDTRFAFDNWKGDGSKLVYSPERSYGPILWAQYTLSDDILKMSAQFMPLGNDKRTANLLVDGKKIAEAVIAEDANNAIFRMEAWDSTKDHNYEVQYIDDQGVVHRYSGKVMADRVDSALRIASLSCVDDVGFPHHDLKKNVASHEADLYVFHGDQLYERVGGYGVERKSKLDYIRKWYIFGWCFRELFQDRPVVIIPDDHDVFHGNLWGEGGKLANIDLGYGYASQDDGGYKERPDFINMVHRTQTGHLPDPIDPTPVLNDISVYYTNMNYKGVSFAILGDRQWKSAPKQYLPNAEIENGWPQNRSWDPKTEAYHPDAELLGPRQEAFLEDWAGDWDSDVYLKAVISQSPFCNIATLPKEIYHDKYVPGLPKYKIGDYPEDDRPVADFDANAWPQNKRNKALRSIRKAFALHFTGDQHLGSTGRYGIDEHDDAGYWISCPAVSNLWPRRWYPAAYGLDGKPEAAPRYTGKYEDGFGNKITVKAVANPHDIDREPAKVFDKAPGYSIITMDLANRALDLAVWPRWSGLGQSGDNQTFPGWPIQIKQTDNYGAKIAGNLAAVELSGDDLLKVYQENTDELLYALKPVKGSFSPFVFDTEQSYRLEIIAKDGSESIQEGLRTTN